MANNQKDKACESFELGVKLKDYWSENELKKCN